MTQTVYIDILICINLIVNFFILSMSFKRVRCNITWRRLLVGAFAGAIFSLVILLPKLPVILSMILKFAIGTATVFISSGKRPLKLFLRLCATFFAVTFAMCGIVFLLYTLVLPNMFYIRNGAIYADISPVVLILSTAVCYALMYIADRITGKSTSAASFCKLAFDYKGRQYELFAKIDTGNSLTEPFSQSPVIVVNASAIDEKAEIFALAGVPDMQSDFRMIPFSSMGGSGLLPAFKASNLNINKKEVHSTVYIAICDDKIKTSGVNALVNSQITEDILH